MNISLDMKGMHGYVNSGMFAR